MARVLPLLTSIAALVAVAYVMPAQAAGPYDGQWVLDAPPAGGAIGSEGQYTCPAIRIPFSVQDGKVVGELHRTASGDIEAGQASNASPITGAVGSDGSASVTWQNFHVTGRLNGSSGTASWAGECGPRTGTITKVGS